MIPTFIRSYEASAEIAGHRIVSFSDAANSQQVATAGGDGEPLVGVSDKMGGASGGMTDIVRAGLAGVQLGGSVEAGDPLTSDDAGKAVTATASAGETVRIIGFADQPGEEDDIIDMWVAPGLLHEPAGG